MKRQTFSLLKIPVRVIILTLFMSVTTFLIFDACFEKVNTEYESFDAFYFFLFLTIIIAIFSGLVSLFALFNYKNWVRKHTIVSAITFYLPVVPLLFLPLWYSDRIITKLLFMLIPFSVTFLQTYHFLHFRKRLRKNKNENS